MNRSTNTYRPKGDTSKLLKIEDAQFLPACLHIQQSQLGGQIVIKQFFIMIILQQVGISQHGRSLGPVSCTTGPTGARGGVGGLPRWLGMDWQINPLLSGSH